MRRRWWLVGAIGLLLFVGATLSAMRPTTSDDLAPLVPYAANDLTSYYTASTVNKMLAISPGRKMPGMATHSISMRFMTIRNIRKGDLMAMLDRIQKERGYKKNSAKHWYTISKSGFIRTTNLLDPQVGLYSSSSSDFQKINDDTRINVDLAETHFLTTRDVIRLRLLNLGRDPFTKA